MCYFLDMDSIGVRELRQNASEVLKDVEAGNSVTVTVAGRPVAQITPIRARQWTTWERAREVFETQTDPDWDADRRAFEAPGLSNPWER